MKTYICKEDLLERLEAESERAELRSLTLHTRGELPSYRAVMAEINAYRKAAVIVAHAAEFRVYGLTGYLGDEIGGPS